MLTIGHWFMYPADLITDIHLRVRGPWSMGTATIDLTPRGMDVKPYRMRSITYRGYWILTIAPFRYWRPSWRLSYWQWAIEYIRFHVSLLWKAHTTL